MESYLQGQPHLAHAIKRLERLNPDQFEIYFEHRTSLKTDSKNQEIDFLSRSEDLGLSVRLIKDGRLGYSFTTSLDPKAIDQAIDMASEVADHMPKDPHLTLQSFSKHTYPFIENFDAKGLKTTIQTKTDLAKKLEAHCRSADSRISAIRAASITENTLETHLLDSSGQHLFHKSSGYTAGITCKAESNGDSQMGGEFVFSNHLADLDIEKVARIAAESAVELLGAVSPPTMRCPAVLRNSVVADLLEFLSDSFSAEQIDKGRSMLAGKENHSLFSRKVSIIDDALHHGGAGTVSFDGEGTPAQRKTLIHDGKFMGALYDTYYAKKSGQKPTGNSVRSIKSPPSIGVSNLYMRQGKSSFHELLCPISKGILITDLMGIHTANSVTGDFSLGASGILIENGKLTKAVKGFAVAGNVLDLFRKMDEIGNDLKFFGRIGAPSVLLSEISVGGS